MNAPLGKWSSLTQRSKVLIGMIGVVVLLLIAVGVAYLMAPDAVSEVGSSMFGADYSTIHFHPSSACVGVGDKIYLDMFGWAWGSAKWQSANSDIATASGHGEITGVKVGSTHMDLKGSAGVITMKEVDVTVKAKTADCVSTYWPNVGTNPTQYSTGSTSFKFLFVSDTQGCPGCSAADGPDLVDHAFAKWFGSQAINSENPAFIVNGGDLAGLGGLNKQYAKQWLDDIEAAWKTGKVPSGKTAIPIYAAVGNHDLTRVTLGESWKSKQADWQNDLWSYYFNNGGRTWPANVPDSYKYLAYSFRYGNSIFIITDDYYMWGNSGNDNDWQGNMMIQEVNPEQVAFVASQLKWAKDNGLKHAFVFGHVPLSPNLKENNALMTKLLVTNGLTGAYFGGHTDGFKHTTLTPALPSMFNTGNSPALTDFQQFIAETGGGDKDPNSYLRVEVNGDSWTVTGIFRTNNGTVSEGTVADDKKWSFDH